MKFVIELTNVCNLKCYMCPRNHIDMKTGYMDTRFWKNIVSMIPEKSTILPFWRGESTLHPFFGEMIRSLSNHDVVLATNGTNVDPILYVLNYFNVINVSIHGQESYEGFLKLKEKANGGKPLVISSTVDGEARFTAPDRIYERHTINGVWGSIKANPVKQEPPAACPKIKETIIAWDGVMGRCSYVWDTSAPDSVCETCDEWMGEGKSL